MAVLKRPTSSGPAAAGKDFGAHYIGCASLQKKRLYEEEDAGEKVEGFSYETRRGVLAVRLKPCSWCSNGSDSLTTAVDQVLRTSSDDRHSSSVVSFLNINGIPP